MSYETAIEQWRTGERRVREAPEHQAVALEVVTERLVAELRRRLGGSFTVDELVELYEVGTSWTLGIAYAAAPGAPWAWEQGTVADAAFARYLREATDYAGGRRGPSALASSPRGRTSRGADPF